MTKGFVYVWGTIEYGSETNRSLTTVDEAECDPKMGIGQAPHLPFLLGLDFSDSDQDERGDAHVSLFLSNPPAWNGSDRMPEGEDFPA